MAVLRSILTKFGFKVEGGKLVRINQQVGAVKRRLNAATRAASQFRRQLGSTANMLRYAAYAFVGSRIVRAFTSDYAQQADAAIKFARSIGMSVEALQELEHASGIAGVEGEVMRKGLMTIAKRARDAGLGLKTQKEAFRDVGVEYKDAAGNLKTQDQLMMDVADRFKEMKAGSEKTALAMELFGRAGKELIPLLNLGSKGINKLRKEARELGIVVGTKAAKSAEEFNDQMRRAKGALVSVRNAIAKQVLPKLTDLFRRFQLWYREGNNARRMLGWLKKAAIFAAAALGLLVTVKTLGMLRSLKAALMAGVTALKLLGTAGMWAQAKVGLLLAGIAFLVLAVQDLYVFAKGGDSLIGRWISDTEDASDLRSMLLDLGAALKELWRALAPAFKAIWQELKKAAPEIWKVFKLLIPYLKDFVIKILQALTMMLSMSAKASAWAAKLRERFSGVWEVLKKIYTVFSWIISPVTKLVGLIVDTLGSSKALGKVWDTLKSVWGAISGAAKAAFKTIINAGKALASGLISGIKTALKKIGDFFSSIGDKAREAWAIVTGTEGRVATAGGRILTKGRAIMTGQGAPVPATKTARGLGLTAARAAITNVGGITVNVKGTANMKAPEFMRAVKTAVRDGIDETIKETMRDLRPAGAA